MKIKEVCSGGIIKNNFMYSLKNSTSFLKWFFFSIFISLLISLIVVHIWGQKLSIGDAGSYFLLAFISSFFESLVIAMAYYLLIYLMVKKGYSFVRKRLGVLILNILFFTVVALVIYVVSYYNNIRRMSDFFENYLYYIIFTAVAIGSYRLKFL